jgi:iron complex transport system substrate-binding protein
VKCPPRLLLIVALAGALALSACASGSDEADPAVASTATPAPPTGKTTYPLTLENCGLKQTITQAPKKVLLLSGTSVAEVESFIVLGLQDTILANAQNYGVSDDPSMVAKINALPTGGVKMNKNYDVAAEQVLALKPDLVVSTWSGGFEAKSGFATREQLTAAGINSLVNPVNCANGKPDATQAEKDTYAATSMESSMEFLTLLGQIFDTQTRATQVVTQLREQITAVRSAVAGEPAKKVLIVFPGMSMMNQNGLPAVMTGGIYDDVIKAAGGVNSFAGKAPDFAASINAEQLAAAEVDVLVVGAFTPQEKSAEDAERILKQFPQWQASKTKTYTTTSDGVYLGPLNAAAVEKIAKVAHPDKF